MSLTSYRAAPPRVTIGLALGPLACFSGQKGVNGFYVYIKARAIMPGDALLFRGLSHSTIGADWFHGRVRDGIGWVTDAMVTKQ